jgi:precorrin-6x reductase
LNTPMPVIKILSGCRDSNQLLSKQEKKAGANTLTIATLPYEDSQYSVGQTAVTMTVREAKALQSFLNNELAPVVSDDDSGVI